MGEWMAGYKQVKEHGFLGLGKLKNDKELDLVKSPAENFTSWQEREILDCGDTEANALMGPLVAQGRSKRALLIDVVVLLRCERLRHLDMVAL